MNDKSQPTGDVSGSPGTIGVTRRSFLVSTLTIGFALAVRPTWSATIVTDSTGLTAGEIRIPTDTGEIPGYRAMPSEGRAFPAVLVVQEIFGVHEHIKDVCRRLAKSGYLAVAPELYARQGDVSSLSEIDEIRKIVAKVPDAAAGDDRSGCSRGLDQGFGGWKRREAGGHRILFGWTDCLVVCCAQCSGEGRRRVVRTTRR